MKFNLFKEIKLPKIVRQRPIAFWVATALHVGLVAGLLYSNIQRWEVPKQTVKLDEIPKAIMIDLTEIEKEKQRLINIKQKRENRLKELKRTEKKVENERYKEQQLLKQLKTKIKQEKKAKIIAEIKRKQAEKEAIEAENKKQEIEKLRQVADKKFKKEQNKRLLKKEVQAEEDQDRLIAQEDILNELKLNYINQIASRIKEKWHYQGAKDSWSCDVQILQDLDGQVKSVNLKSCNIDDSIKVQSFKDSIERAVYKASPLPYAPDMSVFDAQVLFHFKVN